jgi:hypothetical protein
MKTLVATAKAVVAAMHPMSLSQISENHLASLSRHSTQGAWQDNLDT